MRVKTVPSAWIRLDGRRLDCGPYMSGALEAKIRLEEMSCRKDRLADLTEGYAGGIYNGPQFTRYFVDDPAYGVPFLGTSSMLRADLSDLPLLRKRDAISAKLAYLRVESGMTLISCSGTIGRMVYVRPDMEGMWTSQHIMKVVPNSSKVPPGYLYAFLSSKYGVPLITSGTYGAIIQHIEPQHIADLPVPRLGGDVEGLTHQLMEEAALLRAEGAEQIARTVAATIDELGLSLEGSESVSRHSINTISSSQLNGRLDAPYHSRAAARAQEILDKSPAPSAPLAEVVARCFKPPMFKRLWVDDPTFGRQFISGVDAYRYQAESIRYVSHRTPHFEEFILEEGMVIFQAAGQIYGLFGQPLFVSGWLSGLFAADDLYRLKPYTPSDGGFIFAFLKTAVGQILLKRQACGNSIPRVWDPHIRDMSVPWPEETVRVRIGTDIIEAHAKIERARVAEVSAVALVEHAIEQAT